MVKIALDAMGGDYAPSEIIKGAVEAVKKNYAEVVLVGIESQIEKELAKYPTMEGISVIHASEVIGMDEAPAVATRKKRDSSMMVAARLVKEKQVQGMVSAGSTGAQMAASVMNIGRIKGISRPAIATLMPTLSGPKLLLDVGSNVDSKPENLLQFAQMGSLYVEKLLGSNNPKVGLINIGSEKTKGNQLTIAAYELLEQSALNFVGNVEPRDIPHGPVDVMVCDGFVGNCLLKFAEGLAGGFGVLLKRELTKNFVRKLGALALVPGLRNIKKQFDYSEYGGAPLLGINGVSIICHGSSNSIAICNAIKVAAQSYDSKLVEAIQGINDI
ncbi:phosphate acyltransferase PlsX [Desulfitibacter alkalitolerans]|uniref:phosphate acyltransferase PlsX n=1 Tax=Desulfitibacter alkalitolerans TaxID=264641 RepID=UPI0004834644|nr:phosphate acyltransferase PlsX [Desulfitibacter alkalitolerans]